MPRENSTFHEKPLTEEERAEVIRLYEGRMTNKQIAESTSIPRKRIAAFIKEYRESQGLKKSRRSESKRTIRLGLKTRHPLVIEKIMEARSQNPPLSFQKIADKLNEEMPKEKGFEHFSISLGVVRDIYLEQKPNA
jgi:DNA-binding NarL/FixJ family response regulator